MADSGVHDKDMDSTPAALTGSLTLFKFVSLGIIIAFGSAGNALVIYAFGRHIRLRRSPYVLLVGFVSLDLVRVFTCFPVIFVTVVHRLRWKYRSELCQLIAFTNVFCLFGNSLTVLAIALDRYVDTKYKAFHRRKFRGFLGTAVLFIVWGMGFLFAFPAVYGLSSHHAYAPLEAQCTFPHHYYKNDVDTLGLLLSLTTVILFTSFVYCRLFCFLRSRRRMRPVLYEPAVSEDWSFFEPGGRTPVRQRWLAASMSVTAAPLAVIGRNSYHHHHHHQRLPVVRMDMWTNSRPRNNEKLTRLCFVVNAIFTSMWLPYIVVCFWYALENHSPEDSNVPEWLEVTATWLTYLQVAVTPLAFFSFSGFARSSFLRRRQRQSHLSYSNDG